MGRQGGHQTTPGGLYLPQGAWSPQDEQDAKRDRLAERLLEIGLEECRIGDFTDGHRRETMHRGEHDESSYTEDVPVLTVEQWTVKLAAAALAAAEVIYPEPGAAELMDALAPLPAAAQAGAQSVGGFPVEPRPEAPKVLHVHGQTLRGED